MFFKKKGSAERSTSLTISNGTTRYKKLTGLDKYTEYAFQLLAFTAVGDGPKSSIKFGETNEDGKKLKIHVPVVQVYQLSFCKQKFNILL